MRGSRRACRAACTALVAITVVGCGASDDGSERDPTSLDTSTTAEPTTTVTRAQIGEVIALQADPDQQLGYMHADYERIAEMAADYCAALEAGTRSSAVAVLRSSLSSYIFVNGGPGNKDPRMADVSADLLAGDIADAAESELCPSLSSDRFLPDE